MNQRTTHFKRIAARGAAGLSILMASFFTLSCTSTPTSVERGAAWGGVIGGVVGGVAGDDGGDVAAGAAIGAITGAVAGKIHQNNRERYRNDPYRYGGEYPDDSYRSGGDNAEVQPLPPQREPYPPQTRQPQPRTQPSPPPAPEPVYPWARNADQPGHVISPHPPNNLINVEGFQRGELAIDPTTDKVFRVP